MPLPEDPSIPAAEGGGRMSKRQFSSPDFTGQGGGKEGLLGKTQERTPGRGGLLVWLAVYLLHSVYTKLFYGGTKVGGGVGVGSSKAEPISGSRSRAARNGWACSALPQGERGLGN